MMEKRYGGIVIYKPEGITSFDVVARLRKLFGTRKVGHTGTLDPMAKGVLVCLIGRAVKLSDLLTCHDKRYRAGLKLGITTDTEDITGKVLEKNEFLPSEKEVIDIIPRFRGEIMQIPPMYSALKVDGKKLCDLARNGTVIEREARPITVHKLDVTPVDPSNGDYILDVHCSKGTYIRTLCNDIGNALGCGGVMSSLERGSSGKLTLDDAHTLTELENMTVDERYSLLIPADMLFDDINKVTLPEFFEKLARSGNQIYQKKIGVDIPVGEKVAMYGKDGLFAIGEVREYTEGSAIKPLKQLDID